MCCDIHILSYNRMCMDNIPSLLIIIVFGLFFYGCVLFQSRGVCRVEKVNICQPSVQKQN